MPSALKEKYACVDGGTRGVSLSPRVRQVRPLFRCYHAGVIHGLITVLSVTTLAEAFTFASTDKVIL